MKKSKPLCNCTFSLNPDGHLCCCRTCEHIYDRADCCIKAEKYKHDVHRCGQTTCSGYIPHETQPVRLIDLEGLL
jgi:hypothetical protein